MSRWAQFWWHQRRAFRALARRRRPVLFVGAPESPHPASLCTCPNITGVTHPIDLARNDHRADCPWLAAMCKTCDGDGTCSTCGGDGIEPPLAVMP